MDDLVVEGIQFVTRERVAAWRAAGCRAEAGRRPAPRGRLIRARFAVRTYPPDRPFARLRGKDKAIRIVTDATGERIAIGSGTEPIATGAAVLKDLVHILRDRAGRPASRPGNRSLTGPRATRALDL